MLSVLNNQKRLKSRKKENRRKTNPLIKQIFQVFFLFSFSFRYKSFRHSNFQGKPTFDYCIFFNLIFYPVVSKYLLLSFSILFNQFPFTEFYHFFLFLFWTFLFCHLFLFHIFFRSCFLGDVQTFCHSFASNMQHSSLFSIPVLLWHCLPSC